MRQSSEVVSAFSSVVWLPSAYKWIPGTSWSWGRESQKAWEWSLHPLMCQQTKPNTSTKHVQQDKYTGDMIRKATLCDDLIPSVSQWKICMTDKQTLSYTRAHTHTHSIKKKILQQKWRPGLASKSPDLGHTPETLQVKSKLQTAKP